MMRRRDTRRDDFFTRYEMRRVAQEVEPRERERRTQAVAAEALSAEVVVDGEGAGLVAGTCVG